MEEKWAEGVLLPVIKIMIQRIERKKEKAMQETLDDLYDILHEVESCGTRPMIKSPVHHRHREFKGDLKSFL